MNPSYKELLKQREALELQISQARQVELADAIAQARAIVAEYSLSTQDVFPIARTRAGGGSTAKVAPKYRNPNTGDTWTGRGKPPKWIQNEDRQQFLINP